MRIFSVRMITQRVSYRISKQTQIVPTDLLNFCTNFIYYIILSLLPFFFALYWAVSLRINWRPPPNKDVINKTITFQEKLNCSMMLHLIFHGIGYYSALRSIIWLKTPINHFILAQAVIITMQIGLTLTIKCCITVYSSVNNSFHQGCKIFLHFVTSMKSQRKYKLPSRFVHFIYPNSCLNKKKFMKLILTVKRFSIHGWRKILEDSKDQMLPGNKADKSAPLLNT